MNVTRRQGIIAAGIVTVMLGAWTAWRDQSELQPLSEVTDPNRQSTLKNVLLTNPEISIASIDTLSRDPLIDAASDPFKVISFLPPQPKNAAPLPTQSQPKPTTPPFPYRYFGRMVEVDGKIVTYLAHNDVIVPIRAQDILENTYRIDILTDTKIEITYLPLNEKTTIIARSAEER